MISQVQRSPCSGVRTRGRVQPRVCLRNRKVCSMSKRRKEHSPEPVGVGGLGVRAGGPQPHRFGIPVAGQPVHGQPDQSALDDRQRAVVLLPRGAAGQAGVQPVPHARLGGAVAAGVAGGGRVGFGVGGRVGQCELGAVLGGTPDGARLGCRGEVEDPVGADPELHQTTSPVEQNENPQVQARSGPQLLCEQSPDSRVIS